MSHRPVWSGLKLETLRLDAHLGWGSEERSKTQAVDLDVWVRFPEIPLACTTDELDQTVCYSQLAGAAQGVVRERSFRLVEALAYELFAALRTRLPGGSELWIQVKKVNPPVSGLKGGASICLGTEYFADRWS